MKPRLVYSLIYGGIVLTIEAILFASILIYFAFPCGYNGYPCTLLKESKIHTGIFIGLSVTILAGFYWGYRKGKALEQTKDQLSPNLKYHAINLLVLLLGAALVIWSILHSALSETSL